MVRFKTSLNSMCVSVGVVAVGIKTEADSNDITEQPHDDKPSMYGFHLFVFDCDMHVVAF